MEMAVDLGAGDAIHARHSESPIANPPTVPSNPNPNPILNPTNPNP